jgi:hypothetical protein
MFIKRKPNSEISKFWKPNKPLVWGYLLKILRIKEPPVEIFSNTFKEPSGF